MKQNMVGKIFCLSRKLYLKRIPLIPKILWIMIRMIFSADIPYSARIDYRVKFVHNGLELSSINQLKSKKT